MEKLIRFSPLGMILVYLSKVIILGAQPVDAAVLAVLAALCGYAQYKSEDKALSSLKSMISELKAEQEASKKREDEVRTHITTMKMGMNMRQGLSKGP